MRILVLGINYAPEKTGIAPFTTGLCEHLVAQGHTVKVVTAFPYYPGWKVFKDYRGARYRCESLHGVSVRRVWHFVPKRPSSLWQRLAHDLSFSAAAFVVGLLSGKCDLVYCCCPPPTLGLAAYLLSKIKRAPFILKLADLATDAALATGIMHEGLGIRLGRKLEQFIYTKSRAVVCLCRGFVERLAERGVPRDQLLLIPDWGDTEKIGSNNGRLHTHADPAFPAGQFVVLHTGNMGKKQALVNAIQAAEVLAGREDIHWVLVGDGEERLLLDREARIRAPHTVHLMPLQPVELLAQMYAQADLLLLNQKSTVEDAVIPSKLLTYMAAGRPIVAAVNPRSEAAHHIEQAACGVVISAEDPQALAATVSQLRLEPELRAQMGANGRAYAEAHFAKSIVLRQYDLFLERIAGELASESAPNPSLPEPGRVEEPTALKSNKATMGSPPGADLAGGALPVKADSGCRQHSVQAALKRLLDVVVSLSLLFMLFPLLLSIALAIKFTSRGPIFYRWKVVGQGGRHFESYKFRSMVVNADQLKQSLESQNEMQPPMFKITKDPRVTRVGRLLRKYSLDELPQLWSVLVGDMSLVGPRPPLQTEYLHFTDYQKQKLQVKPGLTCLWQVSGRNDVKDLDDWVKLDLMYARHWSLALDLKIALRTLPIVLFGKGK